MNAKWPNIIEMYGRRLSLFPAMGMAAAAGANMQVGAAHVYVLSVGLVCLAAHLNEVNRTRMRSRSLSSTPSLHKTFLCNHHARPS